mmetsp:Transcript_21838/g.45573  ORF Transcript_21838/g.45573 Transcript_21838/m.45573 type:complete len:211 (-) Transcript_21838:1634-2266(-)
MLGIQLVPYARVENMRIRLALIVRPADTATLRDLPLPTPVCPAEMVQVLIFLGHPLKVLASPVFQVSTALLPQVISVSSARPESIPLCKNLLLASIVLQESTVRNTLFLATGVDPEREAPQALLRVQDAKARTVMATDSAHRAPLVDIALIREQSRRTTVCLASLERQVNWARSHVLDVELENLLASSVLSGIVWPTNTTTTASVQPAIK